MQDSTWLGLDHSSKNLVNHNRVCYIRVEGKMKGRRGDRFRMGYDRARECRRSTEVNGRGFRNTDMDHYTTARFKGERAIWLARNEGGGKGRRPRVTGSEGR
ncbi:hypothetical protein K438DRAFT_1730005 [Mycena galopus ATCC 62051]|nr:hypothetical protein K438DRAFT_1730005 [Mycena galopus ATCC 62051]